MKKVILLLVLAGLAWWYFDYSRRMTEAQIRESYDAQAEATRQFDAKKLCDRLSDDFQGDQSTKQGDHYVEEHFDKKSLCNGLTRSTAAMQSLSALTGGMVQLDVDLEIKSIELSINRKEATVQTVSTVRLRDMTLARDRTTEHLIRRNGRILSTGGESKVWAYAPQ
ncbi:hypothetical protein [Dyella sp. 20L07]|uniref:hypothetical protein n=1 Tax=Dyella sp. 20L07 TaxID=3384240 RepID=UPI003D2AF2B5